MCGGEGGLSSPFSFTYEGFAMSSEDDVLADLMSLAGLVEESSPETATVVVEPAEPEPSELLGLPELPEIPEIQETPEAVVPEPATELPEQGGDEGEWVVASGAGDYFFSLEKLRVFKHDGSDSVTDEQYRSGFVLTDLVELGRAVQVIRNFLS